MERYFWLAWRFVSHRWTRYIAAWLVLLPAVGYLHHIARHGYDSRETNPDERRRDGNHGYISIDFSGQWIMGRMLVRGYGRHLYSRDHLMEVAQAAFPRENEAPAATSHDAEMLVLDWFVRGDQPRGPAPEWEARERRTRESFLVPLAATDPLQAAALVAACRDEYWTPDRLDEVHRKRVYGPLYPPIQAFLFAPLALGDHPQWAYFVTQWLVLATAFVCGLAVSVFTRGKIWWPVGTGLVVYFCGFTGSHHLGQNGALSLAVLLWGWVLVDRKYDGAAGVVWGLLAFKPVWAVSFLLVPLLTRRWKMLFTMCLTGAAIALATVPVVGVEPWLDWLKIGRSASETYNFDPNWIPLSRDLLGIPRRVLIDMEQPYYERDRWYIQLAGWALLVGVFETMVRMTQFLKVDWKATTGPAAAFVLLGAWMCCFHFMYYDVLLSMLGFLALIADPGKFVRPLLVTFRAGGDGLRRAWVEYFRPRLATRHPGLTDGPAAVSGVWVANSPVLYTLAALFVIQNFIVWMNVSASFRIGHAPPYEVTTPSEGGTVKVMEADGKPKMHTPQFEITTKQDGPAWDTLALLGVWACAGAWVAWRYTAGPLPAADDSG